MAQETLESARLFERFWSEDPITNTVKVEHDQKNYRTFEQGFDAGMERLKDVHKASEFASIKEHFEKYGHGYRGEEKGIILSDQQQKFNCEYLA